MVSSKLIAETQDISTVAVVVASIIFAAATFVNINIGLIAILLSMLLSPELEAGTAGGRSVVIRGEDLLLIIVSFTWLAKMAIQKGTPFIRENRLNVPIALYAAVLCFSTAKGIMTGQVIPLKGMFYVFKIVEYFILYFIVVNQVTTEKQVKLFVAVLFATCVIVGIYGIAHLGAIERISAPFEGEGEPNTLGGYMLFILAIISGFIYYYRSKRSILILLFIFLVPTFIFTLSRASYLGMFVSFFVFAVLSKDKRVINVMLMLVMLFSLAVFLGPAQLKERVLGAFEPEKSQELKSIGVFSLGPSPAARVQSWQKLMKKNFPKRPLFGGGVTGTDFIDSQYFLVLGETGLVGLVAFLWLMWCVWKGAIYSFRHVERPLYKGLSLGYLVGFAGLMVHAIGSNTFVIIRIAEPFWFFTAIVLKLVDIEHGTSAMKDQVPFYMKERM